MSVVPAQEARGAVRRMPPPAPMSTDESQSSTHVLTGTWPLDRVRTVALVVIAAIAVGVALWAGRDVFVPLALAAAFASVLRASPCRPARPSCCSPCSVR